MKLVRELGRGAFGVVYEAIVDGATVAFKELTNPDARARDAFQRVRTQEHPHLVRLFDWVDHRGFTMELVRGVDLVTFVRGATSEAFESGRPNLPVAFGQRLVPEGASAYRQVSSEGVRKLRVALRGLILGLKYLHDAGFIHGDVRPSNVLVQESGRAVLLDFGLARAHDDGSSYESSPAYAPPELTPSALADWYGVGTALFECLTGQLPFHGSAQHVLVTKATLPAPRPSFLVGGVPDDLDDVTIALLSRVPALRAVAVDTLVSGLLSSPSA